MWKNPKLIDKWFIALPPDARSAVEAVLRPGLPLYLVGGPLRDLLLGRTSLDIDLLTEGDAMALARETAAVLGTRARVHPAFGTATIPGDRWHIDLATARRESYRRPGALPEVVPAAVEDDLQRRDFTINAMALRLDGPDAGTLLDPFGGEADLRAGLIRALHELSFTDDPTRILRAARYAARFGFRIEAETSRWMERDSRYLSEISPARIHHEFARVAAEAEPERALVQLDTRGILRRIHPALRFSEEQAQAMIDARSRGAPHSCFWPLLTFSGSPGHAETISSRLALTRHQRAAVVAVPRLLERLAVVKAPASELVEVLDTYPVASVWVVALMFPAVSDRFLEYLTKLRHLKPALCGNDVIALGVPRGPDIGEVLRRLRAAKLDGEVHTRRDEERFVRELLAGAPA